MNRTRKHGLVAALALSLLGAGQVGAQETPGAAPPPVGKGTILKGRAPVARELLQVRFPRPQSFTLPNGLRIFVLADHRLPVVQCSLTLAAGTLFDSRPGIATLTAAMLNEGTRTRTAQQIAQEAEDLGIALGAAAGSERATLSARGLSEFTDTLLALLADVLLNPSFPPDRLARVQSQERARLTRQRTDPNSLATQMAARVLYGDTPYARESPTPAEVAAIQRQDLVVFHERCYRPNGAILGITGDVEPKAVVQELRTLLASWKAGPREPELPQAPFARKGATRIFLIDRPGSAQTVLSFRNIAISRADTDYVPLTVANQILGGGASGRLFANLREDKGYTYGAYSALVTPRWPGTWGAGASVQTPVTAPAVKEFFGEFRRLVNEPVTAAELERAKRAIVGSFARTLESPEDILQRALELVENGLPLDYWDAFPAKVQAVSAADVQRVARRYLGENQVQLIVVGERAKIEAGLKPYGPVEIYDADFKPITVQVGTNAP
jgi:predicted Zn-dependent peptidase